jgi:hypothetical protein
MKVDFKKIAPKLKKMLVVAAIIAVPGGLTAFGAYALVKKIVQKEPK